MTRKQYTVPGITRNSPVPGIPHRRFKPGRSGRRGDVSRQPPPGGWVSFAWNGGSASRGTVGQLGVEHAIIVIPENAKGAHTALGDMMGIAGNDGSWHSGHGVNLSQS